MGVGRGTAALAQLQLCPSWLQVPKSHPGSSSPCLCLCRICIRGFSRESERRGRPIAGELLSPPRNKFLLPPGRSPRCPLWERVGRAPGARGERAAVGSQGSEKALAQARMLWGCPHPCPSPLHPSRQSNATPKHGGRTGHPLLPRRRPHAGVLAGLQHQGLCTRETAPHRACWGAEPPTQAGGAAVPVGPWGSSQRTCSQARRVRTCLSGKSGKGKNAAAYPLRSENNKPLGDGVCELSLNCSISYHTATPPRLSSRQSGSLALSPGRMEILYYNELFLKYLLFVSSPARFRTVPSWWDGQVCEVGECGAGRCWWNCSRRSCSQHHSHRELPARLWPWLPLPFMFPATGWKTSGEKFSGGSKSSTGTQN